MMRKLSMTVVLALVVNLLSGMAVPAQASAATAAASQAGTLADAQAHWAAAPINRWVQAGIMKGFSDGRFHPNDSVTRAQFAVILNSLFGFAANDKSAMSDVPAGAWYEEALQKAKAAGYMKGYPDGSIHPNDTVSRQDAAVMLTRVFQLIAGSKQSSTYTDSSAIASYAREAVGIMATNGYLSGYANGSMLPAKSLSRAEIAALLDKMIGLYTNAQGSFPSASGQGSAIVSASGASLAGKVISGNLFIIATGDVTLTNVIVQGKTFIIGGGKVTVDVKDSILGEVIVNTASDTTAIVASGKSSIGDVHLYSNASLQEEGLAGGSGFGNIIVEAGSQKVAADLSGTFGDVTLNGSQPSLHLTSGSIDELALHAPANVVLDEKASARQLRVAAQGGSSTVTVGGSLQQVDIQAPLTLNGTKLEKGDQASVTDGKLVIGQAQAGGGIGGGGFGGGAGSGSGSGSGTGSTVDLIDDGAFANGLGNWKAFWGNETTGLSTGTLTAVQGEMKASIQSAGDDVASVQIIREGLSLSSGTIYTVSFDARASIERDMVVVVSDGVKNVSTPRKFALMKEAGSYTFTFTMQGMSTPTGKLIFQLGGAKAPVNVFIDNVKLTANTASIVDKSALDAKIEAGQQLEQNDYTPASWSLFESALITAKEASFSNSASKAEVDQALEGLTKSMAALVRIVRAAGLTGIAITDGSGNDLKMELTPAFRPNQFNYLIGAYSNVATVVLDPKLATNNTLSKVTGATAANGKYTALVDTGTNEVVFEVAESGKANAVYHIYVIKEKPADANGEVRRNPADWQLTWSDEFNGTKIDESKWNFVNKGGGFGNRELEYYTPREENARIEPIDGSNKALVIEARKEKYQDHDYTSAKLYSQYKGDWTYGKYEIRAKVPKSQGIWPAIWMMPTNYDLYGPWPATGEIDIMELIGSEPNKAWGTLHYGLPWKYTNASFELPGSMDFSQDFHTFSIEWEPGEIRWYVDGIFYQRQNDWYTKREGETLPITWPAPFDQDFYMQLNLAVGGEWPQFPDKTTIIPSKMFVDYVRVYKLKDGLSYRDPGAGPASSLTANVPTPRPEAGLGGLIYNGTFDEGAERMGFWEYKEDGTATASHAVGAAINEREFKASIASSGANASSVQLSQPGIPLVRDRQYQLTFKARAANAGQTIEAQAFKEGSPATSYSGVKAFALDDTMKTYSTIFTMNDATDNKARLAFNLGLNSGDIFIDDVKLTNYYPPLYQVVEAESFTNGQAFTVQNGAVTPDGSAAAWLQYNVTVPTDGDYVLSYRLATNSNTAKLTSKGAEPHTRTIHLPNTGGNDRFQTVTDLVHLNAGTQMLLLSGAGYTLDHIMISPNVIRNGSMDANTSMWDVWMQNAGGAVITTEQNQTKLAITAQGDDFWGLQFSQQGAALYKGKSYRVTFEARSSVSRKLRLTIDDPSNNYAYALYDSIALTPQLKTYSFDFTMNAATNLNSRIDFNLGKIGTAAGKHDVYLDQVRFAEIPAVEQASSAVNPLTIDVPGEPIQVQQADGFTALAVNQGSLNQPFDSNTTEYTVKVLAGVTSIALTPTIAADNDISLIGGATKNGNDYVASLAEGENAITFIVDQQGRVPKAYTIHVVRTPFNLLKGKAITGTSGNASLAVDGDINTRWESDHSDPQSITVDMGDRYNVSQIKLDWETSRATAYKVEVSSDQTNWVTVYRTSTGSGPTDTISIPDRVTARYIRMTGTDRFSFGGVKYGYSLFEISATGEPFASPADYRAFKADLQQQITAVGALDAADYSADTWLAVSTALSTANAMYAKVDATQTEVNDALAALSGAVAALVKLTKADGLVGLAASQGTLTPQFNQDTLRYTLIVGYATASVDLTTVLALDNNMDSVTGAAASGPNSYTASLAVGNNVVTFTVAKPGAQLNKTYTINVIRLSLNNAALGKAAVASSGDAVPATDGNNGTRWESAQTNDQWIYVDLGQSMTLTAVQLSWETASAKAYKIQVTDTPNIESSWRDAGSFNESGLPQAPRTDLIPVSGTGQYVRMLGLERNTPWGYSIYEFQVFTN
ncbi:Glucan endo-1,3-beta-D-glucosidase [Paenibacillus curdlanolyticus YK9]|uniref:Glucan endo-1,3-beta-D-glucosidase n=1 Tax=Paenibacillus curdlanolyticus YK9 TaxID=717606 RepID=E0ID12_9BACL|nr:carbohydrate binding domain-containing protein [Paenibacillus curdlanolyticus]EFM09467.1 Glucan endo-1,3-beta-D-glucosidase [Paenibacillus curdlanolyticus YK9]